MLTPYTVVMYGCESWTVKKAEHQKLDAFKPWCWRRLLRVPWTARRSNKSILKEISPGCSFGRTDAEAETPILWSPHAKSWKSPWCWEGLGAGGEGDERGWDVWMASPTQWTWVWVNSRSWWWTGRPGVLRFMGWQRVETTEWLNWTKLNPLYPPWVKKKKKNKKMSVKKIYIILQLELYHLLNCWSNRSLM